LGTDNYYLYWGSHYHRYGDVCDNTDRGKSTCSEFGVFYDVGFFDIEIRYSYRHCWEYLDCRGV